MTRTRHFLTAIISSVASLFFLVSAVIASHSADLTGDGQVDAADLTILKSQWRSTGTADLNHNGVVNVQDAGILFSSWGTVPAPSCNTSTVGTSQLVGCLWDGTNFNTSDGSAATGPSLTSPVPATATALDINWGTSGPNTTVGVDTFSARWKGQFTFPAGTYTFTGGSDDGMRVRLNGITKIDQWVDRSYTENSFTVTFASQTTITFEIDFYENGGDARVNFRWAATTPSSSMGPLKVSSINPRYFADPAGKIVYLTGSHAHDNFKDDSGEVFDYTAFLNFMQGYGHNFMRMWAGWELYNKIPQPWPRTGPGTATDGQLKFDLSRLDQVYFDRLRSRVTAARDRGMYVSVMLFEGWYAQFATVPTGSTKHPMNSSNNINSIHCDPNNDGKCLEAHTLQIPAITAIQEAYVRKTIDTLNDLDNVLWEIANEDGGGSVEWQYHMINYIKNYEATKLKQHPVGMTFRYNGGNNAELFASPAAWISPGRSASPYDYLTNPPPETGSRVVISDTDHLGGYTGDLPWVWKSFTRGQNPIYMEFSPPYGPATPLPDEEKIRKAMGHTLSYAKKMNLSAMTPSTTLCSTMYCLTSAGNEYLVYAPSGGSFTVNLIGATYSYEWFNPSTGAVAGTGSFSAGSGNRSFTTPFSGDSVLYLKKQ